MLSGNSSQQVTLASLCQGQGLFADGDWIESKDQDPNGNVRLIQMMDVGDGEYLNKSNRFLTEEKAQELKCTYLKPGDILISRMPDPVGRACIFPGDGRKCVTAVDVCIVRPDPFIVDTKWLLYRINSSEFRHEIAKWESGATRKRISRSNLGKIPFTMPPLEEQKRIAAILHKANAIRRKRIEAVQLTKDFLRSTFLKMFGDPMTNPKGWPMHQLSNYLTFVTSGSRGWAKYYTSTGARFIRSLDVQMNHISDSDAVFVNPPDSAETRRTLVCPNDVLLTITGSRIGRVAPVNSSVGEAYISQHVAILRLKDSIRPPFLSMFLSDARGGQHQIQRMQYGQTKPGLNLEQLRAFEIPCPPLSMQDIFVSIWHRFDVHTRHHATAEQQTAHLFNSLVQRAFRGGL